MLSWDVDNESFKLANDVTEPVSLSEGEYGAREAMPRILEMLDRHRIPATFFIPASTGILYPELVTALKRRPQHEVALHGWIHEDLSKINDRDEERRLLAQSIDFWTKAMGRRPVGFRAPYWRFSANTLALLAEHKMRYDSSALAMDRPYELNSLERPTGIVELPGSWFADDAPLLALPGGALPSPKDAFDLYREDFDRAYEDRTLFVLTLHPMFAGRRVHMRHLDELIRYMKSKPGVWFATGRDIAAYVGDQKAMR